MRMTILIVVCCIAVVFMYTPSSQSALDSQQSLAQSRSLEPEASAFCASEQFGSPPMTFTENAGQWSECVRFRAEARGATIWCTSDGIHYQFTRCVLDAGNADDSQAMEQLVISSSLIDANSDPKVTGVGLDDCKYNFFIGNDPDKWRTSVPNYKAVIYEDIYSGIDLKFWDNGTNLEYDFIVTPGADPSQILLQYDGIKSMAVNDRGDLIVETDWGTITEMCPIVYQMDGDSRNLIDGQYDLLTNNTFGFSLSDSYDPTLALVIDPEISYSTYLGGNFSDYGEAIAVDADGCAYVAGRSLSTNFPTQGPYQTNQPDQDVVVTKLNPAGNGLVYSTYLGGDERDLGYGIAVDVYGNACVTGWTESTNYPTENAYQIDQPSTDVFVSKLSPSGDSLVFSTYLGGDGADSGSDIAVDATRNVFITGSTSSSNFPTQNPFQTDQPDQDAFVTMMGPEGLLSSSTYLGGNGIDLGRGIAVDDLGSVYISGATNSTDFPVSLCYQCGLAGDWPSTDAFVAKLNGQLNMVQYGTYLGGSSSDGSEDIAVDFDYCAYVTGYTRSSDFPVYHPFTDPYQSDQADKDAFVTKLGITGMELIYSTYLGGDGVDHGYGIAVDNSQFPYITGSTSSTDFPTTDPYESDPPATDAFVSIMTGDGNGLFYSTYLGGDVNEHGYGIAYDTDENLYVTGYTTSSNFPTLNPYQTHQAASDAFVTKLDRDYYMTSIVPSWGYLGNEFWVTVYGDHTLFGEGDSTGIALLGHAQIVYATDVDVIGAEVVVGYLTVEPQLPAGYYDIFVFEHGVNNYYLQNGFELKEHSLCGDTDASGAIDIDDVVYLITYIFAGGPPPNPPESGDADCSGGVDIDDVVYLITYIFGGGPSPCDPDGDEIPDC